MSQGLEILRNELLNEIRPTIMVEIKPLVKQAIHEIQIDSHRVLTINDARKIFGLSRDDINHVLAAYSVPVKFQHKGGRGEAKLFLYRDFSRAVESWIKDEKSTQSRRLTAKEIDDQIM